MKLSKALRTFLTAKKPEHNCPALIDYFLSFGTNLETQINVAAGDGTPVPGRRSTYTDGINNWWSVRIPKHADSEPEFKDYELTWPLELHAEAIGSTGWDWSARRSRYVGFDFDAIVGHAKGVGVTDDKLKEVRAAAQALPYVTSRKSTGGAGLHLYVFFEGDGVPTDNHTEHAALARCVLGLMSAEAGFNFAAQIDACGGNMWFWHRKSSKENGGLELIHEGELFPLDKVPNNWRDHVDVVTRKRAKTRVAGIDQQTFDTFEALASAHRVVPLDESHKAQIDRIVKMGITATWINDYNLLQTHTCGFRRLFDENQDEFGIKGFFQTTSPASDLLTPNCFAFPGDYGSWRIYRFSKGISEARTWEQDGHGWTTCWFNREPNLKSAARALGGRDLKTGGYEFDTLADAAKVAEAMGRPVQIEDELKSRKAVVKRSNDGRLSIEIPKMNDDGKTIGNWNSSDKKSSWTQVFDCPTEPIKEEILDFDNKVRALKTPSHERAGWSVCEDSGLWSRQSASDVKTVLQSFGLAKSEAEVVMGVSIRKSWTLVSLPFQTEYPGDRKWNWGATQLKHQPAPRSDSSETDHPAWDLILNHVGRDLDEPLRDLEWAQRSNIRTGADYLRAWFACVLREPFEPLPYLFFFGGENCGKSIIHEAFSLLVTSGVVIADRALTNQNDFNGELAGAILCVVEEKNIAKSPGAYAKIKAAVTMRTLSIRKMRTDTYQVPNTTHWMQMSNERNAVPVFPGDTRITMIHVEELRKEDEIAKKKLILMLEREAPSFLRTLLDLTLPSVEGRLSLPFVDTQHKVASAEANRPAVEQFILESCHKVIGEMVPFAEFYDRFVEWLPPEERHTWSRQKVTRLLPLGNPCGAYSQNQKYIGNLCWEPTDPAPDAKKWIVKDGKLKRDG